MTYKVNFTKEEIKLLKSCVASGIIDLNEVRNQNNAMKRIEILKAHEEFCKVWQATDGRWKTKIPDATKKGGYRLIAKSSKENLENAIIEHYKALEAEKKKDSTTLATLYPLWKEQQVNKGRSSRTIRCYDDMWKKYYNVTTSIRGCFKMAYKMKIIPVNEFEAMEIEEQNFADKPVYKDTDRVFLKSEQERLVKFALQDYSAKDSVASIGIVLCFELGVRLGELVALKWSDISYNLPDYIYIQRMESKIERTDEQGNYLPAKRVVVNHTKTKRGIRDVYLSSYAKELIEIIRNWHTRHHITSEYIFVNELGERLYSSAFAYRIENYCKHLGISVKRMHCIRRTYISKLFDGNVNISTIQKMCGHADKQTTLNNYVYDRSDLDERNAKIEQALRN